jgi:hypothetical protein
MISLVLGDLILESLTPSVNAPLLWDSHMPCLVNTKSDVSSYVAMSVKVGVK